MGNDPFLGAGQNPAQEGVLKGVGEIVSGFFFMRKNSDNQDNCLCEKMDNVPSLF